MHFMIILKLSILSWLFSAPKFVLSELNVNFYQLLCLSILDTNVILVKNDARYKKYFDMLRVRVPAPAVKQKMIAEGIDPSILE